MSRRERRSMVLVQIAMWLDGTAKCVQCERPYTSVDDFLERNPRQGEGDDEGWRPVFVDDACYAAYMVAP